MTNHPRRQRDQENSEPAEAASLQHPHDGEIPPQGSAEVPAHTGNGVPPGLTGGAAIAAARAVAEVLGEQLPRIMFQAFAAALSQVQVQAVTPQHMCGTCLTARVGWEDTHRAGMEQAMTAAAVAAGVEPGSPEAGRIDFGPFLPEALRPGGRNGIPDVLQAITTIQGTDLCPRHVPGAAGRPLLLAATANLGVAMPGR
jgi:hypothetical protein